MSEPRFEMLDDYARELDRESDLILPPTSPEHVRRAGTSRRRRQLVAIVVVIVAVAVTVGGVVLANLTSRSAAPYWAATPSDPVSGAPTPVSTEKAATSPSANSSTASMYTPSASTSVRPVVGATDVITMLGIGELTLGMKRTDLVARGVLIEPGGCTEWVGAGPIPTLSSRGILIATQSDTVDLIDVTSSKHQTQSGARVGMTAGQVKQIYGDKVTAKTITVQTSDPQGNTRQGYVIFSGNTLIFMTDSRVSLQSSDVVTSIFLLKGNQLTVPSEIC